MANFTKEQLISDIILRITRGKPSDDQELEPRQVAFWIDQWLPSLVADMLNKKLEAGMGIDPNYIKVETCEEPSIILLDCRDCQDNIYFTLCETPVSLVRDRGVIRVATEDGMWVDKISLEELDDLKNLRFSKPSTKNVKYHRVKNKLYFHGITQDTMHLFKFTISYIPSQVLADLDDDDIVYVGDDILPILAEKLEEIARRQTYQSDEDQENNAKQDLNVQ